MLQAPLQRYVGVPPIVRALPLLLLLLLLLLLSLSLQSREVCLQTRVATVGVPEPRRNWWRVTGSVVARVRGILQESWFRLLNDGAPSGAPESQLAGGKHRDQPSSVGSVPLAKAYLL